MNKKIPLTLAALFGLILLLSSAIRQSTAPIPKVWDVEQLKSMHLPYADTSDKLGFITEDYYNQLPVRVSYKPYPFYMPGSEPPGYYDSLARLDPVVNFKEEDLKRIAGVKHVINVVVDNDSIRNVCTGTGRIKIRLGANEDLDMVKLQYLKAGFGVSEHT